MMISKFKAMDRIKPRFTRCFLLQKKKTTTADKRLLLQIAPTNFTLIST